MPFNKHAKIKQNADQQLLKHFYLVINHDVTIGKNRIRHKNESTKGMSDKSKDHGLICFLHSGNAVLTTSAMILESRPLYEMFTLEIFLADLTRSILTA